MRSRSVWKDGMKQTEHKTYGEYMRWFLQNDRSVQGHLSPEEQSVLRTLYGLEPGNGGALVA